MKKFKLHQMYFPLAMALSLSPMALKTVHKEIRPIMSRSLASVIEDPKPITEGSSHASKVVKAELKEAEEPKIIKYEKEIFDKEAIQVNDEMSGVEKQLLDVVLKKDKEFEQGLHDSLNAQFAKIDELEKVVAESDEDKKIISDKVEELRKRANELCDKLEKVAEGTKYEEKKEEVAVVKEEPCDLEQKYSELSKQVEAMTADHKKYLDVIVSMSQMMASMYQQQQPQYSPYTYSFGPFGNAYYPSNNNQSGLGQVTNNYYYGSSNMQNPQMMSMGQDQNGFGQYVQQPQVQQQPQQQPQVPQYQVPQTYVQDPRYSTMQVMPGSLGDAPFMHNFETMPAPMVVDTGRAPAVVAF